MGDIKQWSSCRYRRRYRYRRRRRSGSNVERKMKDVKGSCWSWFPALSLGRRPFSPVRLTTSPSHFYHSDESNKHNANGSNFTNTTNDTNSNSNKDLKANSQGSNTQWNLTSSDKGKSYQDTISAVQALSRSQMEKLQRDIQPLIHRVQDATNTLKRLTHDVTDSKDALKRASMALNELTGYNQIELVKKKVTEQAMTFELTRDQVQVAKKRYELAIATRSSTQRSINELLQRKHLWTGEDVTQFTELYRLEHEHAKEEDTAKEHYHHKEKQMDREYMALARSIMERYHDEQLWSDKIRSVSTYGTWALMVLNLMLFVAVQTVFEPRKRKRLTDRFEELLVDKVAEQEEKFGQVAQTMAETDQVLVQQQQILVELMTQVAESSTVTAHETATPEDSWTYSEQQTTPGVPPMVIEEEEPQLDAAWAPLLETNDEPTMHTLVTNDPMAPGSIVLSQRSLILYSLESAVAGGLITALAVFLWK
ncbi:hypothetical protein [Absidia glauca]|uniref:Sensitive to high expression protein 9, mitochondrial n=1 Tax=Absidia glauca TaxID=4829 RepID=A0A168PP35_ABSGL|nr:hypothetical protein [Absidia glauca]